jgi:hypothetical protein
VSAVKEKERASKARKKCRSLPKASKQKQLDFSPLSSSPRRLYISPAANISKKTERVLNRATPRNARVVANYQMDELRGLGFLDDQAEEDELKDLEEDDVASEGDMSEDESKDEEDVEEEVKKENKLGPSNRNKRLKRIKK